MDNQQPAKTDIMVQDAAKDFLLACRADGLKVSTMRWYRHMIKSFVTQMYGKRLLGITAPMIRLYVVDLRSRSKRYEKATQRPEIEGGLSHESMRDHITALRRFFRWCWTEYNLEPTTNPMLKLRMPGRERKEPKAISIADLERLLAACDDSPIGLRNEAMFRFLADTGCRLKGMLGLTRSNLYLQQGYAVVTEKYSRDRAVPFISSTAEAIEKWLAVRPLEGTMEYVFCSLSNRTLGHRLTEGGLHSILKQLKKQAAISGRINPHSFRHGFAREYLAAGGDLGTLSQIMGHSSVKVTVDSYAVFKDRDLALFHAKHSPMRKVGKK